MDERLYALWLANGLGPAAAQAAGLLARYDSTAQVYDARMSLLRDGLITPAQQKRLAVSSPADYETQLLAHEQADITVLTIDSEKYPALLRDTAAPPVVLYVKGDVSCLNAPFTVGMVGTRRPSAYGMDAAAKLADGLAHAGAVLVSGLADGLDSEAHKAAVRANMPTVAVLGTAIDVCFPARNAQLLSCIVQCGAAVSEFPIGTRGQSSYFLMRNRIIAGLSHALAVVEARKRSGTMSTVHAALEYGRDVYAVPGSIFSPLSEGTNSLLAEGARMLTCAEDLLADFGLSEAENALSAPADGQDALRDAIPLSPVAVRLASLLGCAPKGLPALCEESALASAQVLAALTELELAGISCQLPGRLFARRT